MTTNVHTELLEAGDNVSDAFLEAHRTVLLDSLGAVPGVDAVRASVVRLLSRMVTDPLEYQGHLQKAAVALRAYPDAVASGDPVALMQRHPAWVGLAHIEVAEALGGDASDALQVAIQHARLGFSAAAGGPVQDGEVLWAMAETAEEAGWEQRGAELLRHAAAADFADEGARARVLLLAGQSVALSDSAQALRWLEDAFGSADDHTVRVQAAFVAGVVHEHGSERGAALDWFEKALAAVDRDDAPDVAERIGEAIRRVSS